MPSRLDVELVRRGLARSRAVARAVIAAGEVTVDGRIVTRPATAVDGHARVEVRHTATGWVGRGADKLLAALAAFAPLGLTVAGRRALDAGASTGGFTQVLLAHGVASVAAVDVGHGQLAPSVAADPRVQDHSGTSIRGLDPQAVGGAVDLLVADLSFISLTTVLPDLRRLVRPGADVVLLVKPQFEVGRGGLGKKGIVRDPRRRAQAVERVAEAALAVGLSPFGLIASPLRGSHGNAEYLLWLRTTPAREDVGMPWDALLARVDTLTRATTIPQEPA